VGGIERHDINPSPTTGHLGWGGSLADPNVSSSVPDELTQQHYETASCVVDLKSCMPVVAYWLVAYSVSARRIWTQETEKESLFFHDN